MVQNRFSDNDPYIQTIQTISANNNQLALNAAILENDYLRSSSVTFNSQSITRAVANPAPDVIVTGTDTIGSALGNIGQEIAVIGETGGSGDGGGDCFLGNTLVTLWDDKGVHREVPFAQLYHNADLWRSRWHALSFDDTDAQVQGDIGKITRTIVYAYSHVTFSDFTADDVISAHRYFCEYGAYIPIRDMGKTAVLYWHGMEVGVISIDDVHVPNGIAVYNMHVKEYQNYVANGRRVHNLKPLGSQVAEQ